MRRFMSNLSAGERFSAIVIAFGFFSVIIPAAIAYDNQANAAPGAAAVSLAARR